ncbi:MAG TPA: SDR family NAD(P)-dependent oxidoreductase, partial [Actinomycetota bacterium]|nr:SDR family NAD(P)-dependent oxidoreductase [Actinomycetota bacterium]
MRPSRTLAPDATQGLVAVVTGGGTGIGAATAHELARTGARVAICGRRVEPIERTGAELVEAGADVLARSGVDVREPEQVSAFVDAVLERFGRIDVLVNNAGGQYFTPAEGIAMKGWRAVWRLNVGATLEMTRAAVDGAMRA